MFLFSSFANNGRYQEGIVDFERALTIKHTHSNARKYLVETQIAYGEEYVSHMTLLLVSLSLAGLRRKGSWRELWCATRRHLQMTHPGRWQGREWRH